MDLVSVLINAAIVAGVGAAVGWLVHGRAVDLKQRIDRLEDRVDKRMDAFQSTLEAIRSDITAVAFGMGARSRGGQTGNR